MPIALFITVAGAVIFYRIADHERFSPLASGAASLAVTAILTMLGKGLAALLMGQLALFGLMWWLNMRRLGRNRS